MERIDILRGGIVGLDTAPRIYFIEKHPAHIVKLRPFFAAADRREFRIVTSPGYAPRSSGPSLA